MSSVRKFAFIISLLINVTVTSAFHSPLSRHNIVRKRSISLRVANIEGLIPPESLLSKSDRKISEIDEVDYIVIGSGIGGLSCAALLNYYGYDVLVLESHYLAGTFPISII